MYCAKCGKENREEARFCAGCGAVLNGNQNIKTVPSGTTKLNSRYRIRKMILAVAVVIAAFIALVTIFGGRSYKATIKQYIDAQFDVDAEKIFELIPREWLALMLDEDEFGGMDFDEMLDYFVDEANEEIRGQLDYIETYLGENWEVTYEILSDDDLKGNELDELKEDYADMGMKISAAKTVEVQLTVKTDDMENSDTLDVSLVKIGRSWYLDVENMDDIHLL